jgi:hypothetical protein
LVLLAEMFVRYVPPRASPVPVAEVGEARLGSRGVEK